MAGPTGGYMQVLQPAVSEVQPSGALVLQSGVVLQVRFAQLKAEPQVTSHAHEEPQLTSWHDPEPEQSTLHRPVPQVTALQLCEPLQVIVHDLLPMQLTPLRHELPVEHAMLQSQPVGHAIAWLHATGLTIQSIVQLFVAVLHDVHGDGQPDASPFGASSFTPESSCVTTQSPSEQIRPELQSACV